MNDENAIVTINKAMTDTEYVPDLLPTPHKAASAATCSSERTFGAASAKSVGSAMTLEGSLVEGTSSSWEAEDEEEDHPGGSFEGEDLEQMQEWSSACFA